MEENLGYALYLGPSILDHSCRPSAEVGTSGKNRGGRRREGGRRLRGGGQRRGGRV